MASYDADDAKSQIAQLRRQVDGLMSNRVTPALANVSGRAESAARQAGDYTMDRADDVAEQVRGRPLVAIMLAGFIGFILGRFVR
jgi:ElaB/YqjD/DUF883 family membrane-anchored ribosome-binding protein